MPADTAFERVGNDLFLWKHLWLLDGQRIRCCYCEQEQSLTWAHQALVHGHHCPGRTASAQYPWQDLVELLCAHYQGK
ncbi:hypothetical protein [Pseudomonas typographi]|uniref:Uncharacterized protein n=1 Tax=Pseudomonas typographi TaxID=2715964 RepID=A0ABR7Z6X6_9PSED|nr:hypothetical protein [Pseudomonas typographi]MBD1553989.1 hypothetical protein [Pseudomonas typographi]MBD1589266.1 hypothetical protein [Pseudomonas typographi]MBD1601294.1 hypothetical protein [Pseudomonas typographi]